MGEGGDRFGLGGGLGYLRQGGGAGAGVGGQALFGEEGGQPLQDWHAVVPLLGPGEAGEYLPGSVGGGAVSAGRVVQDAQAP